MLHGRRLPAARLGLFRVGVAVGVVPNHRTPVFGNFPLRVAVPRPAPRFGLVLVLPPALGHGLQPCDGVRPPLPRGEGNHDIRRVADNHHLARLRDVVRNRRRLQVADRDGLRVVHFRTDAAHQRAPAEDVHGEQQDRHQHAAHQMQIVLHSSSLRFADGGAIARPCSFTFPFSIRKDFAPTRAFVS